MREELCLACSASLLKQSTFDGHRTQCCRRPICARCLKQNPRLARYDPCLYCMSGTTATTIAPPEVANFVLGDDDEDDEADDDERTLASTSTSTAEPSSPQPEEDSNQTTVNPTKYYLQKGDTLQGLALKFGFNGRELCKLNNLPPTTLSTLPHLLHTRRYITLPPSASKSIPPRPPTPEEILEARRRERAGKRMQMITKEVDWGIAKAYVALADEDDHSEKEKPSTSTGGGGQLESRAVDRYLDDLDWETQERAQGRQAHIQPFPYFKA